MNSSLTIMVIFLIIILYFLFYYFLRYICSKVDCRELKDRF